jgi:hypothetical protein
VWAAYIALLFSLGSLGVSFLALWQEQERAEGDLARQLEELARQVVFVEVGGEPEPVSVGGDEKPAVGETSYTVANFGPFPVEDVVLEAAPEPNIEDRLDEELGITPTVRPQQVQAVRLGTIGPCQSATVPANGETYVRAVFSDIDGRRWAKAEGSPPDPDLPDAGLERVFPFLGSEPRVYRTQLMGCR